MPEHIYKKQPLYIEQYEQNNTDIYNNLVNVHNITEQLADNIATWFNNNSSEKTRLKNEINDISGTLATLRFASASRLIDTAIFTDELNSYNNVDMVLSGDNVCNISTAEGAMSLGIQDISEIKTVSIKSVSGNGSLGNYNVGDTANGKAYNISTINARNKQNEAFDGNPLTWIEYQTLNVPQSVKDEVKYDLDFCNGKEQGDTLQMKIIVEVQNPTEFNCISIAPYIPQKSNELVVVSSIKTSLDGINYTPIYKNQSNINVKINTTSSIINKGMVNRLDQDREKYKSMGIFFFEMVTAKYIEIVLLQPNSYRETIAHTYYMNVTKDTANQEVKTRITSAGLPVSITSINTPAGRYSYTKDKKTFTCEKGIELLNGWRYCIGVRDISVFKYTFNTTSQVVSNPILFDRPIKKICLLSEEIFPEKLTTLVGQTYGFIRYYISIDDVHWAEIMPLHRQQKFAPSIPKIIEIGDTADSINSLSTSTIYGKDVQKVRVKIVMSTSSQDISPSLESYSVKVMY